VLILRSIVLEKLLDLKVVEGETYIPSFCSANEYFEDKSLGEQEELIKRLKRVTFDDIDTQDI
jgi:hypothetical protein